MPTSPLRALSCRGRAGAARLYPACHSRQDGNGSGHRGSLAACPGLPGTSDPERPAARSSALSAESRPWFAAVPGAEALFVRSDCGAADEGASHFVGGAAAASGSVSAILSQGSPVAQAGAAISSDAAMAESGSFGRLDEEGDGLRILRGGAVRQDSWPGL